MVVSWEASNEPPGLRPGNGGGGHRLRIYVSSTLGELAPEREAAKSAIKTLRLEAAGVDLGTQGNDDLAPLETADIFVGIYWQSYGYTTDDSQTSPLEEDYDRARAMPRLVYVKEPASDRDPRLLRL
ncbi:MAG TPA: DUF4062 domain-containing protein, partial [Acidimicrobiia bacterium]|nr:DUF4062 domain-containing protein [Acidimicrobiia bacterium]